MKPGQLITGNKARVTARQHRKPCTDCPWARESLAGWLGRLSPSELLAAAHGEAKADCHALKPARGSYDCAGLAIYRANVCKTPRDPKALRLPANHALVFSGPKEFLAHHCHEGNDHDTDV